MAYWELWELWFLKHLLPTSGRTDVLHDLLKCPFYIDLHWFAFFFLSVSNLLSYVLVEPFI